MSQSLERVVIITGAASGIGAATARRIAGPGTGLVIHTRKNAAGLDALRADLEAAGSEVTTILGDLAEPDTAGAIVALARDTFGGVDQIVSNAGQAQRGGFGTIAASALEKAFAASPIAFFRLIDAALPDLEKSSWGRVVAVTSFLVDAHGTGGLVFASTAASKAALASLAATLAYQLAPTGTTVNCVSPGFTAKGPGGHSAAPPGARSIPEEVTPNGRIGQPDDVAAAIAFLLSRDAGHITGETINVNGGLLLPGGKRR